MKKLLKFNKLFEYYDYLDNIDNVTFEEIEVMSNILNEYQISEGLIKTYPIQPSVAILKRKFPSCNISIDIDGEIIINGNLDKEKIKILSTTLGYLVSREDDNFIELEPKYDREIENIQNIIYHSTLKRHLKKIKKLGLIPKSKNKLSNHPDRIYFSLNIEDAKMFSKYLEKTFDEKSYIVEVSTKGLTNKYYSDINFRSKGIYTLNNIPKENIINII